MTAPPAAGPATAERWKLPLLQVTALENWSRETRWGRNAELAGQRKVRAAPAAKRQRYTQTTGACTAEITVSPRLAQAMTAVIAIMICLRLKLSATWPAGRVNRIIGPICVSPTKPSASAEWVRS